MSRVIARDITKQGDDDLRGIGQSRSRASVDWDTAAIVGIESGPVSEREEFTQVADGVSKATKTILGPALMGKRILGMQ